ncbi:hypothetical protein YYC_01155 [Plasmodium yoelii 17X]|uniref:Fam-a protein n=1 Tax=Plasmodium yoelii 17X TaxID=1323249 RepID=V7PNP6_PLAYE|nr:hypothetical protein YYC_01155 [Plasmodium yoelii 17X]
MNKFYVQIALFILTISLYVDNKTLAAEPPPGEDTPLESTHESPLELTRHYLTSEEIYEKNKHLLCANPEETTQVIKLMHEAIRHLEYHVTSKYDYKFYTQYHPCRMIFYQKQYGEYTKVRKIEYINDDRDKYNEIVKELWDPDHINFFYKGSAERKIVRVYNQDLVMIQQRSKNQCEPYQKYFYALAAKAEISEDATVIAMTSANINDHHPTNKKYKNALIENANLFKTEIDSEDDIRNGTINKTYVNLIGYLIKKKNNCVNITYIESIAHHIPSYLKRMIRKVSNCFSLHK